MSFDRLAPHYRWMEFVLAGSKLQRCRTAFLGQDPDFKSILIAGEGNGHFLAECRRQFKTAHITCVDSSKRMIEAAQERLVRKGLGLANIDFVHADALEWLPPGNVFDAVVTHFFLDCFTLEQVRRLIASFAQAAKPQAVWLLADFNVPATGVARYRAKLIHLMMYTFFRATTRLPARALVPPDDVLLAHNFRLKDRMITEWGLLHSDRWLRSA